VAMDEEHLAAALRYVSLNPVRARLVDRARDWRWSSVRAHLGGRSDGVTTLGPVRERYPDFANFLSEAADAETIARLRRAETIGRPLGNRKFLEMLERERSAFSSPSNAGQSRASRRVMCTVTVIAVIIAIA
jgi:putative transposase